MVGQWTATKPSRSDEVPDADEQARISNRARAQFDSMAPKRPTKPNRSESDSPTPRPPIPLPSDETIPLPELEKFRSLQSQSQAIITDANIDHDEFVETQYYNQLSSVDKQHHTTGSGFIKVVWGGVGDGYDLQLQRRHESGGRREVTRTNPATNDWIPSTVEDNGVGYVSTKPNRSESG